MQSDEQTYQMWRIEETAVLSWIRVSSWRDMWVILSPWQPEILPQEQFVRRKEQRMYTLQTWELLTFEDTRIDTLPTRTDGQCSLAQRWTFCCSKQLTWGVFISLLPVCGRAHIALVTVHINIAYYLLRCRLTFPVVHLWHESQKFKTRTLETHEG